MRRLLIVLSLVAIELVVIAVLIVPTGADAILPYQPLEWWWPWV